MYKVMAVRDDVLEQSEVINQIQNAHCVEFTCETAENDNICDLIESTSPDIAVVSLSAVLAAKNEFADIKSDTQYLVVYDSFKDNFSDGECVLKHWGAFDIQGDENIVERIAAMINQLKSARAKENFEKMVIREAERVKPIIREQFFKEFILGVGNTEEVFKIYCQTFNVSPNQKVYMLLFRPEQELGFEDAFFLKNIIESHIGMDNIIMSTVLTDHILVVSSLMNSAKVSAILRKLEKVFAKYYDYSITTVYSGLHPICETPEMYKKMKKSMEYCFYTDNSHIVSAEDIVIDGNEVALEPNYGAIERAVKSADGEKMQLLLHDFFKDVERSKAEPAVAKTYCLELYVCIIRCCEVEKIDKYMKGIMELQEFKTLSEISGYILNIAKEIVQSNSPKHTKLYSTLINNTMDIIEKNIGNEHLSLRWIANNILYTNVDYLGKLFKKEIGENFSHYVMEKRMELAKRLIIEGKKDRIYEVAEKVGYGSNSQYFSQVFKKYTGVSPLEYKEYARASSTG